MSKKRVSHLFNDDVYSGVIDQFRFHISKGAQLHDIINQILSEGNELCPCITKIALAECLWHVGAIEEEYICNAWNSLRSKELISYFQSLGADEAYIESFRKDAANMLHKLSNPLPEKENWLLSSTISHQKGECFWYKCNNSVYGGIFLENQRGYKLVALTERLSAIPKSVDVLLNPPLYTIAWFSDETLLSPKRLHNIGSIEILKSFVNKFGLHESNGSFEITNYGQGPTWKHSFRMYRVDCTLAELMRTGDG